MNNTSTSIPVTLSGGMRRHEARLEINFRLLSKHRKIFESHLSETTTHLLVGNFKNETDSSQVFTRNFSQNRDS